MDGLQARLHSFKKSKRVKNPNKSSTTSLKWPHPVDFIANPSTLAEAGFYYDPSYDDPDNVTCFNCEKQLAGWEEDDDPYLIHWNKCAQTCCWAAVQCGLRADMDRSGRFVFPDKSRLPNHKTMEKARLETFALGKGWIHDKTRNHGANSKSMARAGFAYTPHDTGDDLASCLYCNVSLSGWDEDDDPMEEHRKRATKSDTNCPFFEHIESPRTKPSSTKPPSKSTSKPPSRTTSRTKHPDVSIPMKTFDDAEEESDIPSNSKSTTQGLGAKTPAKPRSRSRKSSAKTPAAKSRSVSRSGLKNVVEEVEDDEKATEPPPTMKKKTRSASKSNHRSEALKHSNVEDENEKPPPAIKPKSRTRSKTMTRSELVVQTDGEVEEDEEKATELPPTVKKKTRSASKSVPKPDAETQGDMEKPSEAPPNRPKSTAVTKSEQHNSGNRQPIAIESTMDVSMHGSEPGVPETVTDTETELHTAPSTPPRPVSRQDDRDHTGRSDAPLSILHTSDDISAVPQPSAPSINMTPPVTTEPLYLPPLSRLPFMPLQTLSEAELDMTVEDWIRYQIEVEQDRFKRDGERELEIFKKRAEEVRNAIEAL